MSDFVSRNQSERETALWHLYRDFFAKAERRRRWSIEDDIKWDQCNPGLNPAIADVVASFCAVELYLPDYLVRAIPPGAGQPGRGVVLRQLGLRGVEALAGPGRLAAEVGGPHRRADGRPGVPRLRARLERPARQ